MKYIIISIIIISILYWYCNVKHVSINENNNKKYEYFVISANDKILKNESDKNICSQIRLRDFSDITAINTIR